MNTAQGARRAAGGRRKFTHESLSPAGSCCQAVSAVTYAGEIKKQVVLPPVLSAQAAGRRCVDGQHHSQHTPSRVFLKRYILTTVPTGSMQRAPTPMFGCTARRSLQQPSPGTRGQAWGIHIAPCSSSSSGSLASNGDVAASPAAPPALLCPITQELMTDPAIATDGHTYERVALESWLLQHDTSPMTGLPLDDKWLLLPNLLVRSLTHEWREINEPGRKLNGACVCACVCARARARACACACVPLCVRLTSVCVRACRTASAPVQFHCSASRRAAVARVAAAAPCARRRTDSPGHRCRCIADWRCRSTLDLVRRACPSPCQRNSGCWRLATLRSCSWAGEPSRYHASREPYACRVICCARDST